jgi:L-ascorbate metabolism protein UlaG (beta-lactamase superfamily)
MADAHASNTFETPGGPVKVHPIAHASIIMGTPAGTVYVDPLGDAARYDGKPASDLILITHARGDHFNVGTLNGIVQDGTQIVANGAVFEQLPDALKARAISVANGGATGFEGLQIGAIPAYNLTEECKTLHPQGRDNGHVLSFGGLPVYVSGDTEDIPEMRGLKDIDVAFVCMNLPFTMDANAAASALSEFAPS